MTTSIDIARLQTLTIEQRKAQIAEVTGQTVKSNNRPYLLGLAVSPAIITSHCVAMICETKG